MLFARDRWTETHPVTRKTWFLSCFNSEVWSSCPNVLLGLIIHFGPPLGSQFPSPGPLSLRVPSQPSWPGRLWKRLAPLFFSLSLSFHLPAERTSRLAVSKRQRSARKTIRKIIRLSVTNPPVHSRAWWITMSGVGKGEEKIWKRNSRP